MSVSVIPSRVEWSAASTQGMAQAHHAFGWKVHRHQMPAGSRMVIVSTRAVPREKSPNRALFIKGRASVVGDDGTVYPDRVPGLWTPERPDQPAGTTKIDVLEDMEFWCFNYTANRNALPDVEAVRMAADDVLDLYPGALLFVASGEADGLILGPCSVETDAPTLLIAATDLYGFIIGEAR